MGSIDEWVDSVTCGDCLEVMRYIPNNSIDMILCDLPYGVTNHPEDVQIPLDKLWEQYRRIIKPAGPIVLTAQGLFAAEVILSNKKMFKYDIVWDKVLKSGFLNSKRQPLRRHEQILVFYYKQPKYNPQMEEGAPQHSEGKSQGKKVTHQNYNEWDRLEDRRAKNTEKYPSSIVTIQKPHPSVALHRTEKPVQLFEYLIKTFTDEGDIVLDNCIGCGTTAVACRNTNRKFVGIDISEEFCEQTVDRINKMEGLA